MSVTRPIPTMFFVAVLLMLAIAAVLMLSSVIGRHDELREETRSQIRALVTRQLELLAAADVKGLQGTFTESVRPAVTPDYVRSRQAVYARTSAEQLLGPIELVDEEGEPLRAVVKTPEGRLLTHLVRQDGVWLCEDLWMR